MSRIPWADYKVYEKNLHTIFDPNIVSEIFASPTNIKFKLDVEKVHNLKMDTRKMFTPTSNSMNEHEFFRKNRKAK